MAKFFETECDDKICDICRLRRSNIRILLMQIYDDITAENFPCPKNKPWIESNPRHSVNPDKCIYATCANCNSPAMCRVDAGNCPDPFDKTCSRNPDAAASTAENLNAQEVQK